MKTYKNLYVERRKAFWANPSRGGQAGIAAYQLRAAKRESQVRAAWDNAEDAGLVRLRIEPDESCGLDDLLGDCFDQGCNPDIKPEKLERERQWEIDRIERDGVWGVVGEYMADACPMCGRGGEWTHGASCWGFVGDDWRGDAEVDIMEATLKVAEILSVHGLKIDVD